MTAWVLGAFGSGEAALAAVERLKAGGLTGLDAYSPWPVEGMAEALGLGPSGVRPAGLVGGLLGAGTAFYVQWWLNGVNFPINVGNRPLLSSPAFIPITFESMVLAAGLTIFFVLLYIVGLPRVHHPVFEVDAFRSASEGDFWVSVRTSEDGERDRALECLSALQAAKVTVVEEEGPW